MKSNVLGWKAKIQTNLLKKYKITFQYNYDFDYLVSSIKNGDFLSETPFTINKYDDELYIYSQSFPKILEIASLPVTVMEEEIIDDLKIDTLDIYAQTAMYLLLSSYGYKRPSEILSFIGKTKGVASQRINPRKQHVEKQFNQELKYSIFEAERFESHEIKDGEIIIFYDPRFEISEETFNLTSKKLIPKKINEEIKKLHRNYQSSLSRFKHIDSLIKLNKFKEIEFLSLSEFQVVQYKIPSLKIKSHLIETSPSIPLIDILENNFLFDNFVHEILVLLDNTSNGKIPGKIYEFIEYFEKISGITIILKEFKTINIENIDDVEAVIICINDTIEGTGFIYSNLKNQLKMPNKVIRFKTILSENWDRIVKLVWLALRFRYTQTFYQNSVITDCHQNTVAIHLTPYFAGEWMILSGVSITSGKVNLETRILYNDREKQVIDETIVINFLNRLLNFPPTEHFLLEISERQLLPTLKLLSEFDFCLTHIYASNSVFYGEIDSIPKPIDGLSINLNDSKSLIMTNGYPNDIFDGIPKPIIVEKIKGIHGLYEISSDIFNQTFTNPYSLSKPKLPFCLSLALQSSSESILVGGLNQ